MCPTDQGLACEDAIGLLARALWNSGAALRLSMITYLDRACLGAAAPSLVAELSLSSEAELKWAFAAFAIAYAIFEIPSGWLGDTLGPRGTLLRIVAWWSLCTALDRRGRVANRRLRFWGASAPWSCSGSCSAPVKPGPIRTSPVLCKTGFQSANGPRLKGSSGCRAAWWAA